jgi:hypothetical protein
MELTKTPKYSSNSITGLQQAIRFQSSAWYDAAELARVTSALTYTNLASLTSKFDSLTILRTAATGAPYVIITSPSRPLEIRFNNGDPTGFFLCRDFSSYHQLIQDLSEALSTPPAADPNKDPAVPLFYTALSLLTDTLASGYGFFNYLSFELQYSLIWS